jgi:hypothetical protein
LTVVNLNCIRQFRAAARQRFDDELLLAVAGRRTAAIVEGRRGHLEPPSGLDSRPLKRRFENVPAGVSATIRATDDPQQLDEWLDRFATATTLGDIGIGAPVGNS